MDDKEKIISQIKKESGMAQLLSDKDKLSAVLNSDDGRKLIALLSRDGGAALKQAANAIASGNSGQAKRILEPLMEQDEARSLVEQLNKKIK